MEIMINGIIWIKGKKHLVYAKEGTTALSLFRETGEAVYAPCGGNGTCGKCRMYIRGEISAPDDREKSFLTERELQSGVRLACMCRLLGDFEIIPMDEAMRIQTSSKCISYTPFPLLRAQRHGNETVFYKDGSEFCRTDAGAKNLGLAVDIDVVKLDKIVIHSSILLRSPFGSILAPLGDILLILQHSQYLALFLFGQDFVRQNGKLCHSKCCTLFRVQPSSFFNGQYRPVTLLSSKYSPVLRHCFLAYVSIRGHRSQHTWPSGK